MVRAGQVGDTRGSRTGRVKRGPRYGYVVLFILPAVAIFAIFVLYPLFQALSYSLFEWKGTTRAGFIGFGNFTTLFTKLPYKTALPQALTNNLLFFAGLFVAQNTFGMFVAYQLQRFARLRRFFQTIYAMPYLLSSLVVGYLWTLILSPSFGPLNAALKAIGLEKFALPWLGHPTTAIIVVIMIAVWQWLGFPILLYSAGLSGLPEEVLEAAAIDGATGLQRFRHVIAPLMLPVISTVSILTFIYAMEIFPLVYAMGGSTGSPAGSLDVIGLLFYRVSFQSGVPNAIGASSAVATIMFFVIFGIAMVATSLLRSRERRMM